MPNYNYECKSCEIVWEEFSSYEDREGPKHCSMCNELTGKKVWVRMPGITRASYIDSNKTARARELEPLKQAAKLEAESFNVPIEQRGEIKKEIKKLKSLDKS